MSPLLRPLAAGRSAAAFPPAPETRSTKTGNDSHRIPRANCRRLKSTKPDLPDPAQPFAGSVPPILAVQPFPLALLCNLIIQRTIAHPAPGLVAASLFRTASRVQKYYTPVR